MRPLLIMQAFNYELVYPDGERNRGRILAENERSAVEKLRVRDCKIIRLELVHNIQAATNTTKMFSNQVLFIANFNIRLAGQLRAGIPLLKALNNIRTTAKGEHQQALQGVITALNAGEPFSNALDKQDLFPDFMVAMAIVGENTGMLADILQDTSEYYFDLYDMQIHLKQISLYPLFLCVLILIMFIAFITFVVPSFASLYAMLNIELHGVLRGLLFVREHLLFIGLTLLLVSGLLLYYVRYRCRQDVNYMTDIALHIPFISQLVQMLQEVRLCRVLSMQLNAGVDLLSAVKTTKNCVSGTGIQQMLELIEVDLTRGITLYEAAKIHNCFLSEDTLEFIAVGEEGNGYASMLTMAHTQARMNLKDITASLKTYLQPVIFLITAAVLGAIIVILLQPMLGVLENVGNNW